MQLIAPTNPVFEPVHRSRCRYVVMRGSAGSGKSADTAQSYIIRLMTEPGRNLVCIRKIEDANRSSTFAELCAAINRLGVGGHWETHLSPLSLRCRVTGAAILFRGVLDTRQREKLKSITFPEGKLTDVWIEEATELEQSDLEIIDDRLRGELPEGLYYQIKLTFNPVSANHWLKARFFDHRDPSVFTHHSTYRDNRFIDSAFYERMERRRVQDPDGWRVYGLGEWGVGGGQYFSEWRDRLHVCEPFVLPGEWRRYLTLDYGLDMLAASGEEVYQAFAPPDLWNRRQDTGKSAAEIFGECGLVLSKAENDRVAGWYNLKEWLKPAADGEGGERARLRVFANCENLIRTLPALKRDERNPNDAAREPHELTHAPDALRYFVAGRPIPAMGGKKEGGKLAERLGMRKDAAAY